MSKEVSEFLVQNFITQIYARNEKKYFNSLTLALNLARINKNYKAIKELEYIKDNTTDKIGENLSVVEELYTRNNHKSLNKTLTIFKKQFYIYEIIRELSEAYDKMLEQVIIMSSDLGLKVRMDFKKYGLK